MSANKNKIEKNLQLIRQNIDVACARAGRSPSEVSIVAVTKSADIEAIQTLVDLGQLDFGESRAQQLSERAAELAAWLKSKGEQAPAVKWHMIGHLQRNKVRPVLDTASIVHSVDSLRLAEDISERAQAINRTVDVMLQVNCSQEQQKYGVAVGAATHLAELVTTLKNVRLVGLMTMAPLVQDLEQARPSFRRLREIFDEMRNEKIGGADFRNLSMGMSNDYMIAVEEGATMLRIGTALFL